MNEMTKYHHLHDLGIILVDLINLISATKDIDPTITEAVIELTDKVHQMMSA